MDIELAELPPQPFVFRAATVTPDEVGALLHDALPALWTAVAAAGGTPTGAPLTQYVGMDGESIDIRVGIPVAGPVEVDGAEYTELPGGRIIVGRYVGSYDGLGDAHLQVQAWMTEHELVPSDGPWEIYETDPGDEPDASKRATVIHQPVEPA